MKFIINKIGCTKDCVISAFYNPKTGEENVYEISAQRNDYAEIIKQLSAKDTMIVGYGNYGFDNLLYNFLIDNYYVFLNSSYRTICSDLHYLIGKIFKGEDIGEIRYKKFFESMDLKTLLFSKENRLSIVEMQVSIKFEEISNFVDFDNVEVSDFRRLVTMDCLSIVRIFKYSKPYLKLRLWIYKNIGIDCLTLDNVTSGSLILGRKYCEAIGENYASFRERRRYFTPVHLKDIILPIIHFETDEFNCALESFKKQVIPEKSKYPSIPIVFRDRKYTLTGGGLHQKGEPKIYEGKAYIQADCTSQYPTFIHNFELLDPEFKPEFLKVYHEAFEQKELFDDDPIKREFFKIILNSYYGCLLNEHKPFFCPEIAFKTVVNCQLMMLMLAEKLILHGIDVVSLNTDSIDVFIDESQRETYNKIMSKWQAFSKFKLTYKEAKRVFRKDCNSYIMELVDGTVITKGDFNISDTFGKIHNYYVSKLAAVNYLVYGTPIEETIYGHKDILDFCEFKSIDSRSNLMIGDKKLRSECRFYVSNKGGYLYQKNRNNNKIESINKGFQCTVLNKCENTSVDDKNINYKYYIMKAKSLVESVKETQKKLF